ncbi:aminotransferase class IV [Rhodobacter sp. M37P]|uniref:Probable branched-chain-amino-acid aminotransferase n=1 Tax=Rhodobacter calidifons TaxID=2715277 RepID=A0ABX0G2N9_9RHOB|nr:aminotransferase class IV [Rhodobacter calidifons]NHB75351.1 aminotransferase class IV [Rhodobacter calidifons]
MLWDGAAVPRWRLHLDRLRRSAEWLGWACPEVAPSGPDHPARLRLTLDRAGGVEWTVSPLPPAKATWRVALAGDRLDSADPWLRVKSTRRAAYDRARAALAPELDEVLFVNERGEVCDGSITTVFFDRGEGMRTPPLSCGLLPGVLRAEIGCPEEVLMAEDLPGVRLWVGNALRGLIPALWVG